MGDFHEYYSGQRTAPILTIFCGGNHEASNYLYELYYGGWVAPNIYYLGATNVLRLGPIRIAGMSGIFKGFDYRRPRHERVPYNSENVTSAYHLREIDVRKLMQVRTPVDIGLSHDWPNGIENHGDTTSLFTKKRHLRGDSVSGRLGSEAASNFLDRVRPAYWLSAHLHTRFALTMAHDNTPIRKAKRTHDEPIEWQYETFQPKSMKSTTPDASHTALKKSVSPGPSATMEEEFMRQARLRFSSKDTGMAASSSGPSAWNNFAATCAGDDAVKAAEFRAAFNDPSRVRAPTKDFNTNWKQVKTSGGGDRKISVGQDANQVKNNDEIDIEMTSVSDIGSPPAKRMMTSKVASDIEVNMLPSSNQAKTTEDGGHEVVAAQSSDQVKNNDEIDIDMTSDSDNGCPVKEVNTEPSKDESAVNKSGAGEKAAVGISSDNATGPAAWKSFAVTCAANDAVKAAAYRAAFNDPSRVRSPAREVQANWKPVDASNDGDRKVFAAQSPDQVKNNDEIDIDMTSGSEPGSPPAKQVVTSKIIQNEKGSSPTEPVVPVTRDPAPVTQSSTEDKVADGMRSKLPASLARRAHTPPEAQMKVVPEAIQNKITKFLALDKPGGRDPHLELMEIQPLSNDIKHEIQRPLRLQYDKEWLAITRVFANELELNNKQARVPRCKDEEVYLKAIKESEDWVEEHIVKAGKLDIPENFVRVAPVYDPSVPIIGVEGPPEYPNPQTQQFCDLIGITNKFALTPEQVEQRMVAGPPPLSRPDFDPERRRGKRGGHHRGRGRNKGGNNANRNHQHHG